MENNIITQLDLQRKLLSNDRYIILLKLKYLSCHYLSSNDYLELLYKKGKISYTDKLLYYLYVNKL